MADEIELLRLVSELIPEPTTGAWVRAEAAIAAAREEDLLRQDTKLPARDLRARAGMTRRFARRLRRGVALRPMAAVSAVLAAAAVVSAVIGVPGAGHDSGPPGAGHGSTVGPTVDAAYVVERVGGALSAAGSGAIAHMTVTIKGLAGTLTAEEWSSGDQWRVVYSRAGQPVFDAGFGTPSVYTLVSYQARTWARQRGPGGPLAPVPGQSGCKQAAAALSLLFLPGLPDIGSSAGSPSATVVSLLRKAITCGTLTDAGRQRVDGIEATELTSSRSSLLSETIWVDPATYLPVRVVVRPAPGSPVRQRTADITWLKPTAQNRAKLTVPIPAGFRQAPFSPADTRISP
jgi:hypothetical protein